MDLRNATNIFEILEAFEIPLDADLNDWLRPLPPTTTLEQAWEQCPNIYWMFAILIHLRMGDEFNLVQRMTDVYVNSHPMVRMALRAYVLTNHPAQIPKVSREYEQARLKIREELSEQFCQRARQLVPSLKLSRAMEVQREAFSKQKEEDMQRDLAIDARLGKEPSC